MEKVGDAESEFSAGNEVKEASNLVENDREMMTIDRLNALPDCLLIHILSFLGMKGAAITSVLSKRWQYLWIELPKLNFQPIRDEKTRRLVTRVHRTLVLRAKNHLDELEITMPYREWFASDVNAWVEIAVKNRVKKLCLRLYTWRIFFYMLPHAVFTCSSLTSLFLQGCTVAPQATIDWKYLTELGIQDVELHDHVIRKIFSSCPILRSLSLETCWGFECLDIDSQCLHNLSLLQWDAGESTSPLLEISAPYVRSLDITLFPLDKTKLRLTNIQSLVRANVHLSEDKRSVEEMNSMMELCESIRHVKKLELGCVLITVLSDLFANGRHLPQSSRDSLIVETWKDEDTFSGIIALLDSSPYLETLVIHCPDFDDEDDDTGSNLRPVPRDDLDCDLLHLKTVNLIKYADPKLGSESMLTLARILLKRATALEKMVIEWFGNSTKYPPDDSLKIAEALLSYPKSSQNAVVVFSQ